MCCVMYALCVLVEVWRLGEEPGAGDTVCCEQPDVGAGTKLSS